MRTHWNRTPWQPCPSRRKRIAARIVMVFGLVQPLLPVGGAADEAFADGRSARGTASHAARYDDSAERLSAPEQRLSKNKVEVDDNVGDSAFKSEQRKALRGDGEAALRVAGMYRRGLNGVPRDDRKMVQWLLYASTLDNGAASYQLYLYYLELKLDRDAVFFENRALEQGYKPPPKLDPRRG